MTYIKIDENIYPATIDGIINDKSWDGRESKTITLSMTYAQASAIFVDGLEWSIVCEDRDENDDIINVDEFDNSNFNIAGDIVDHRDGTLSIKMGKPTDLEEAYELLYGGEE